MTFKNYLISKKTLIIFFFLFQFLALFVNIFGIEGQFNTKYSSRSYPCRIDCFFTDHKYNGGNEDIYQKNFWPFVDFFTSNPWDSLCDHRFRGVFRYYDYSEFIAYSLLFFLILYLAWNPNKKGINKKE